MRARFKVSKIETSMGPLIDDTVTDQPSRDYFVWREVKTVSMVQIGGGPVAPFGTIRMTVEKSGLPDQFALGREFYVDFTPATIAA